MRRFHIKAVQVATAGALVTSVVNQAVLVVSGVLVARLLGVEHRGSLAVLVLVPTVLAQLGHLGLPLAVTYWIASAPRRTAALSRVIARMALAQMVVLTLLHAALVAIILRVSEADLRVAALFTLALTPGTLIYHYGLAILQGQQRFIPYYAVSLLPGLFYSVAVAGLWLADEATLASITLVWTVAWTSSGVVALLASRLPQLVRAPVDQPAPPRAEMLRFGLKGLLGSAAPVETFRVDQALVGLLLSRSTLGLYVVAMAFTNLLRFLSQSIGLIAYPRVATQRNQLAARRTMWTFFGLTFALCIVIAGVLQSVAGWLTPFLFGSDFQGAVPITRIILVGAVFLGGRRVLSDGARGIGRPMDGTIAEVISWFWLVPALWIATPRWGVEGVAWSLTSASCIALISLCALVWWSTREAREDVRRPQEELVASRD